MRSRAGLIPVFIFILAAFMYFFYPSDENRIRKVIRESRKAVVSEDHDGLMEHISYAYADDGGNNYLLLKNTVRKVFNRFDGIDIEMDIMKLSVTDDRAEAELAVRIAASAARDQGGHGPGREYIVGDPTEKATLMVHFEKSMGTWLISGVEGVRRAVTY